MSPADGMAKVRQRKITVTMTPQTFALIEALRSTGLYGFNVGDAAMTLIYEGLRKSVLDGILQKSLDADVRKRLKK